MSYVYEKYDVSLAQSRFKDFDRVNHFGYDGIKTLFNYLEQLADDIGSPVEFDVIALCCEYSRYENIAEFQKDYGDEYESLDDIRDDTTLIEINPDNENGPFIIQSF